jgi:hypothetical protein
MACGKDRQVQRLGVRSMVLGGKYDLRKGAAVHVWVIVDPLCFEVEDVHLVLSLETFQQSYLERSKRWE